MDISSKAYARAFEAYLRKGTPIDLSLKSERTTTHYIWRTQGDRKVRPDHKANDGLVFSWDDPPPTGHPGEDFGCRCVAEPYEPQTDENITITLSGISDSGSGWENVDFVQHYYFGGGRGVTVRETGHLGAIVSEYMSEVEERLKNNQIAVPARLAGSGNFTEDFYRSYNMTSVVFSIGGTVIGGDVSGIVKEEHGILELEGTISFYLKDEFADPISLGIELGGDVYPITDEWSGQFKGKIYADEHRSKYK